MAAGLVRNGAGAQSPADLGPRWALSAFVNAGASAWSQPVAESRLSSRPAGGAGLAVSHVHSAAWRGVVQLDWARRGANGLEWQYQTRYTEAAALVLRNLFTAGPFALALGGGPVLSWARGGEGASAVFNDKQSLDLSAQEYSARFALEARLTRHLPLSGRVTFQRGFNRVLHANPDAANGRWDGTTPPYSKWLGFELGAELWRW